MILVLFCRVKQWGWVRVLAGLGYGLFSQYPQVYPCHSLCAHVYTLHQIPTARKRRCDIVVARSGYLVQMPCKSRRRDVRAFSSSRTHKGIPVGLRCRWPSRCLESIHSLPAHWEYAERLKIDDDDKRVSDTYYWGMNSSLKPDNTCPVPTWAGFCEDSKTGRWFKATTEAPAASSKETTAQAEVGHSN